MRRPSRLVRQTGHAIHRRSKFLQKTKAHYWQCWILPPIAPTLNAVWRFCLFLMLWSPFGDQVSDFFSAFAAVDGM
jgi:hypothetical protein